MNRTLLLLLFTFANCFSQAPTLDWVRVIGGNAGETANSIITTADGGYIIAGYSISESIIGIGNAESASDMYIIKFNSEGETEWETAIGGTGSELAASIIQTGNGEYVVGGTTFSNDGDAVANTMSPDFWLVKLSSTGQIIWQNHYGSYSGLEEARQMKQTPDGGYIIVGIINSPGSEEIPEYHGDYDYFVVKTDSNGNMQWQRSLGGSNSDQARTVLPVSDGYVVAGYTMSTDGDVTSMAGCYDTWLVKLDLNGDLLWQRSIGGNQCEMTQDMKATNDGGIIFTGYKASNIWVYKTNVQGEIEWEQTFAGSSVDQGYAIDTTSDGGYIISGTVNVADGIFENVPGTGKVWVLKLDSAGGLTWQKRLGGSTQESEIAYDIKETEPGHYILCGNSYSIDGDMTGNHGWIDLFVAKLVPENLSIIKYNYSNLILYPNPTTNNFSIILPGKSTPDLVTITDASGKIIKQAINYDQVNVEAFPSGIYFINIISGNFVYNEKLVIR